MSQNFFNSLQIYRGVAAMMVVFHHIWNNVRHYYALDFAWIDAVAKSGRFGVDFFFVLSGFIICYSNFFCDQRDITVYLKNRFLRIFIPYWPIGICMLGLYFMFPAVSGNARDVSVLKTLFLIPVEGPPALSVAWTLVFEIFFYLVFSIWFFSKRGMAIFFFAWIILIFSRYSMSITPESAFLKLATSYYNLEFILGVAAAWIYRTGFSNRRIATGLILLISLALIMIPYMKPLTHILLGAFFSCIILVSLNTKFDHVSARNFLMIIGNASYSLYLVHNPVISFALRILRKYPIIDFKLVVILVFLLCLTVGILYSKVFEEYGLKRVRQLSLFQKSRA